MSEFDLTGGWGPSDSGKLEFFIYGPGSFKRRVSCLEKTQKQVHECKANSAQFEAQKQECIDAMEMRMMGIKP